MTTLLSLTSVRRGRIAVLKAEMTSPDAYDGLRTWTLASRSTPQFDEVDCETQLKQACVRYDDLAANTVIANQRQR